MTRRQFVARAAPVGGVLAPSLVGLIALGSDSWSNGPLLARAARGEGGYGDLVAAGPELALPPGFSYKRFGVEGSIMSDTTPTPPAHDGMGASRLPNGNIRLVRNHGSRAHPRSSTLLGDPSTAYDTIAGGGTTSLEIATARDGTPELVRDFLSLNGSIMNCAGGPTPWGTWLTCEKTTQGRSHGWRRPHGYVFEVDAHASNAVRTEPIRSMGRFVHEAVAIDPNTGIVYQTEDRQTAGFYRYVPDDPGQLHLGGRLQMLAVSGQRSFIGTSGQGVGVALPVSWVDIDDPDPSAAEENPLAVFAQGRARGGALFSRLEGCWYGDDTIFFAATTGGNAEAGQIWQYQPTWADRGHLTLLFESPSPQFLNHPDNLTVSPRGGLAICENASAPFIRGLTRDGQIFDFAMNIANDRKFAGACFSPDGRTLFVNIQGDTIRGFPGEPGSTFAIWGPWEDGAL